MDNRKRRTAIVATVVLCCAAMAVVDGIIQPAYAVKSAVKIILFLLVPLILSIFDRGISLKELLKPNIKGILLSFALCIPMYAVILAAYLLLKDTFDFSQVTESLTANIGVTKENFIFVALYISFANSLLEEFFFRGFAFLTLRKSSSAHFSYIFSSAAFSLYHIAIMTGWFSIWVFVISLAGLFAGGMIFNYINSKSGNIYTSWLVHMFANFAINTIGLMLFGII